MQPQLTAVRVAYTVERTVYVEAASKSEAHRLARDVGEWVDADPNLIHERMDTLRVVRQPARVPEARLSTSTVKDYARSTEVPPGFKPTVDALAERGGRGER